MKKNSRSSLKKSYDRSTIDLLSVSFLILCIVILSYPSKSSCDQLVINSTDQKKIKPIRTITNNGSSPEYFVQVRDGKFYRGCSQYYLVSMNYWGAMNLAADESVGGNLTRFQTEVKQLAYHGVNNVRIMAASEGSNNGIQPYRMYPPLQPSVGIYDEKIFIGLDRAISEFSKYNITVVMTLQNFWHWSGGYSQYVSWATNDSEIPYPRSWDPNLNPPWGDYAENNFFGSYDPHSGKWSGFTGYAGRF